MIINDVLEFFLFVFINSSINLTEFHTPSLGTSLQTLYVCAYKISFQSNLLLWNEARDKTENAIRNNVFERYYWN